MTVTVVQDEDNTRKSAWLREAVRGLPSSTACSSNVSRRAELARSAPGVGIDQDDKYQETGEYYLAIFTPDQPDLNWENPEVRAAVWDVMHFWLKRGVAGFRMDVINMISKVPGLPDADPTLDPDHKYHPGGKYFINGPKLHDYLQEMHREVLSKYDTITVGEMPGVSDEKEILRTVGANAGELNMIFIFDIVDVDKPNVRLALKEWRVRDLKAVVSRWQRTMIENDGWNTVFIENHDNPRSVSRYTDDSDQFRDKGAKLLALMQTTLGGTLFVYQGEEIGVRNAPPEWSTDEYKDVETINYWKKCRALYSNDEAKLAHGRKVIQMKARDHSRTPMQWSAAPNAGFCDADQKPWMRLMDDWKAVNAEAQMNHDSAEAGELSVWQFWQRGLKDRKEHTDVFVYGDYQELDPEHESVLAYVRTSSKEIREKWIVVLNFSGKAVAWSLPDAVGEVDFWACSTYVSGKAEDKAKSGKVKLKPWEGLLGKLAT